MIRRPLKESEIKDGIHDFEILADMFFAREDALRSIVIQNHRLMCAAYKKGYADAVRNFCVRKNEHRYIGLQDRPVTEVLREVDEKPDEEIHLF